MTTLSSQHHALQTLTASKKWCIQGKAQGYQGRQSLKLDRTPVMASVFTLTLNPEAPQ